MTEPLIEQPRFRSASFKGEQMCRLSKISVPGYSGGLPNMSRTRTALCARLMMSLSGCANEPSTLPTLSQNFMMPPRRISNAAADCDLIAGKETAECVRELRLNIYRWQVCYKALL